VGVRGGGPGGPDGETTWKKERGLKRGLPPNATGTKIKVVAPAYEVNCEGGERPKNTLDLERLPGERNIPDTTCKKEGGGITSNTKGTQAGKLPGLTPGTRS